MAEKIVPYTKKIGDMTFSTHEGSGVSNIKGMDDLERGAVADYVKGNTSILTGETALAFVEISTSNGKYVTIAGHKEVGDQEPLMVDFIKLPGGKVIKQDPPMTINFDKETTASKGMVTGAITNDSAKQVIGELYTKMDARDRQALFAPATAQTTTSPGLAAAQKAAMEVPTVTLAAENVGFLPVHSTAKQRGK